MYVIVRERHVSLGVVNATWNEMTVAETVNSGSDKGDLIKIQKEY